MEQIQAIKERDIASRDVDIAITKLETKIQESERQQQDWLTQQAETDTAASELHEWVEGQRPAYDAAMTSLAQLDSNKAIWRNQQAAQTAISSATAELNAMATPPVLDPEYSEETLASLRERKDLATAEVVSLQKVINLLNSGTTECPTCSQQFKDPQVTLAEKQARLDKLMPPLDVVKQEIIRLEAMWNQFNADTIKHKGRKDELERTIAQHQFTLDNLPTIAEPSDEAAEALKQAITGFEHKVLELRGLELTQSNLATSLRQHEQTHQFYLSQLAEQQALKDSAPSQDEVKMAEERERSFRSLQSEQATIRGALTAHGSALENLKAEEDKCKFVAEKGDNIRAYRTLLEEARLILHRDNLPMETMSVYLGKFEAQTNKFLTMFGNPFAVEIARNMEMTSILPSGFRQRCERLSGGQRAVLSVSARFAIHEIFSKQLGFLVMDEPSQNMDDDNVKWMARLLEQVGAVSRASCAQTLVVTHHVDEMTGVFDNTITLAPVA
jgi:chromosome segregation ATPase